MYTDNCVDMTTYKILWYIHFATVRKNNYSDIIITVNDSQTIMSMSKRS